MQNETFASYNLGGIQSGWNRNCECSACTFAIIVEYQMILEPIYVVSEYIVNHIVK